MNDDAPYVGPGPFETSQADRFFGRKRESYDLLSFVIANPIVLVYAVSGAGKSSLLNAGLVPLLKERSFQMPSPARVSGPTLSSKLKAQNIYLFYSMRQWNEEFHKLLNDRLSSTSDTQFDHKLAMDDLAGKTLSAFLKYWQPRIHAKKLCLIFDQFEEFFTEILDKSEQRKEFFQQCAGALAEIPGLRIVLAIQEEFIAQLEPFHQYLPDRLRPRMRIEPLREAAALEAIKGPLESLDLEFASDGNGLDAATQLVDELRQPAIDGQFAIEPLQLQVVCQNLWRNLPEGLRTYALQRKNVEPTDKRETKLIARDQVQSGEVDKALSRYYESAIAAVVRITGADESMFRNWIEQSFIRDGRPVSAQPNYNQMPEAAIKELVGQRILRPRVGASGWYELSHARMIKPIIESNRLHLGDMTSAQSLRQKLLEKVVAFGRSGVVLDEGSLLQAELFIDSREGIILSIKSDPSIMALLQASRQKVDADKQSAKMTVAYAITAVVVIALIFVISLNLKLGRAEDSEKRLQSILRSIGLAEASLHYLDGNYGGDLEQSTTVGLLSAVDAVAESKDVFVPPRALQVCEVAIKQYQNVVDGEGITPPNSTMLKDANDQIPQLISPDGNYLLTIEDDNRPTLRSTADYQIIYQFGSESDGVSKIGFSYLESRPRFGICSTRGKVRVWNTFTGIQDNVVTNSPFADVLEIPPSTPGDQQSKWIKSAPKDKWQDYESLVIDLLLKGMSGITRPYNSGERQSLFQLRSGKEQPMTDILLSARGDAENQNIDAAVRKLATALKIEERRVRDLLTYSFLNEANRLLNQSPQLAKNKLDVAAKVAILGSPAEKTVLDVKAQLEKFDATLDSNRRKALEFVQKGNEYATQNDQVSAIKAYKDAKRLDPYGLKALDPETEARRRTPLALKTETPVSATPTTSHGDKQ